MIHILMLKVEIKNKSNVILRDLLIFQGVCTTK